MRERKDCRLCGGELSKVFALAPSAIANNFKPEPDSNAEKYPLELMKCDSCGHVQLRHVISGLFEDYKYQTPSSNQKDYASGLRLLYKPSSVLEIGSNNGILIDALREQGVMAIGVDPSNEHQFGIRAYFTDKFAKGFQVLFDLVVANNVFAHIDDLQDVFRGIDRVLTKDGHIVFEVQYLPDLISRGAFDMIYHEHLDYHTLRPLAKFLKKMGFVMTMYERIPAHGGSIRVHASRKGDECKLPQEPLDWALLKSKIMETKSRVYLSDGVVAFGAAAKACTLINELGIAPNIRYCVDDTPRKQGRYIPGTDIQIKPVSELGDEPVLLTAWNYEREVRQRIPNKLINPFR